MKARSRPAGGLAELSRASDSKNNPSTSCMTTSYSAGQDRTFDEAIVVLLTPARLGATPDDDITVRFGHARTVVSRAPGLTRAERVDVMRALPWDEVVRRAWSR